MAGRGGSGPSWRSTVGQFGFSGVPMVAGSVLAWAWLLSLVFLGVDVGVPGFVQVYVLVGLTAGLLAIVAICRRGKRGPELGRRSMLVLGTLPSLALFACALLVPVPAVAAVLLTPPAMLLQAVLWVGTGVGGAYAVRRSLLLFEALAARVSVGSLLFFASCILAASSALGLMVSRMDGLGAVAFVLVAMPLSLRLLPQGRPALPGAPAGAAFPPDRLADRRPLARPLLLLLFAAIGFTCGFHTAVGPVIYVEADPPTVVFLMQLAGELVCATVLARLPRRVYPLALQLLCAASLLALAPLLFVEDAPGSLAWHVLQSALITLSVCSILLVVVLFARVMMLDDRRDSRRFPSESGIAVLTACLLLGWASGAGMQAAGGVGGSVFQMVTTLCIALMLLCVVALGLPATGLRDEGDSAPGLDARLASEQGGAAAQSSLLAVGPPAKSAEHAGDPLREAGVELAAGPAAHEVPHLVVPVAPSPGSGGAPDPLVCPPDAISPARHRDELAWRYGLSERERGLLDVLARGLNAQQIADELMVSRNTVKTHMAHIYAKVGIHTRAELDALLGPDDVTSDTGRGKDSV